MNTPCPHTKTVSAYLDGELSTTETRLLEDHLLVCPECWEELASLRELSKLFGAMRDRETEKPARRHRAYAVAAALLIGFGALLTIWESRGEGELRFEAYLDRAVDRDVLEVTTISEPNLSRDQVVGMLISSTH